VCFYKTAKCYHNTKACLHDVFESLLSLDEEQETMWGGKKNGYYDANNIGYEVMI
jgi:hypothetical protein